MRGMNITTGGFSKKTFAVLLALGAALALPAVPARAKLVARDIAYEDGATRLQGYFVYNDEYTGGGKKIPGVLVAPEWWGLNDYARQRAQQLAGLGYAAFVVDMYGGGASTSDAKQAAGWAGAFYGKPEAMAARARAGLEAVAKQGVVDVKRLAAIGYCFGGAVCQALAYDGAPLAGIVSFHGSLIPASAEAAGHVKTSGARFLICQGAIDPFIKPEDFQSFKKSLDDGGVDYQLIEYSGAVHAFTNPKAGEVARESGLQGIGYNAAADKASWEHMRLFLTEAFAGK